MIKLAPLLSLALAAGCLLPGNHVVVYTALDQEFCESIFEEFTEQTGIAVRAKYDTESTKTVNLTNAIIAEANRSRCDVFWNNEILNTHRLAQHGLLAPFKSAIGAAYPTSFRSSQGLWHGFAARARVLIVNRERVTLRNQPTSILALADPQWKSRVGMAKPLFGTTATHAAVLFHLWGAKRASQFFAAVQRNANIMAGNKRVAVAVSRGQLDWGITDTDDAMIEIEAGYPVQIIFPDQDIGEMGTLFIPNSIALIRNSPNSDAAKQLIEFLISPKIESRLAKGPSAQMPLHPDAEIACRVPGINTARRMTINFEQAAQSWDESSKYLHNLFHTAE